MAAWEPLSSGVTGNQHPLFSFRHSRAEIEGALGPPQGRDLDSKGMGAGDAWAMRFPCGLELVLWGYHIKSDGSRVPLNQDTWIEVEASECDFAHIAAHLPFELRAISPWLPDRRTYPSAGWLVMRQDDNGNVFEVHPCSTRCEADLRVTALESLGHKQMYWVEERPDGLGRQVQPLAETPGSACPPPDRRHVAAMEVGHAKRS